MGSTCNLKPIQFTFTGTKSSSPIATTFNWDFATEANSSLQNPLQQLNNTGKKAIKLKVSISNGCIDIITKDIDIKSQAKADFDAEDVCEDSQAVFINKTTLTSGKANYHWSFGDGKTSTADVPSHQYSIGGISRTFNVKLAANVPNACSDSITKAVTINAKPKQGFTYSKSGQTVNFTATESNATNYQWTFGDGGTANTSKPNQSYTYSKFSSGKYTACLRVTNLAGCFSDSCIEIQINLGFQTFSKGSGTSIFPNPNTGNFTLKISEPKGEMTIEIYNQIGQILYKLALNQAINQLDLNLANGVYLVKVMNGGDSYNSRVIARR